MAPANPGLSDPEELSRFIVLLASFQVTRRDALHIKDANREFQFDPEQYYRSDAHDTNDTAHYWAGNNNPEQLSGPYFGLPWDYAPKNGHSFVFGSLDPELDDKSKCSCDFQLADSNSSGISRLHVSLDISPRYNADQRVSVRLNCLSHDIVVQTLWPRARNGTKNPPWVLQKGDFVSVTNGGCVAITVAHVQFLLWMPKLTAEQEIRRRELAFEFAVRAYSSLPTHFPSLSAGVETVQNCVRVGSLSGNPWMKLDSASTAEEPFFQVWQGDLLQSAWQPTVKSDTPLDIVSQEEAEMEIFCTIAAKLPEHPNVYRFKEIGRVLTGNSGCTLASLPWAIGEHVPPNAKTLAAMLEMTAAGKPRLATSQRLSVFQQLCSAVAHAHRHGFAHGRLAGSFILAVETASAASESQEGIQDREIEKDSRKDKGPGEIQVAPPAPTIKVFGFSFCNDTDPVAWTIAMDDDKRMLGHLGVLLLSGCDVPHPYPGHRDRWWMEVARRSDMLVQPVLVNLLRGKFTVENAMHLVGGILQDERAASEFTEVLQTHKRTAEALRLPPQASSKRVRPEGRPDDHSRMERQSHSVSQILISRRQVTVPRRDSHRSTTPAGRAKTPKIRQQSESTVQRAIRAAATDDEEASQTNRSSAASAALPALPPPTAVISDNFMQSASELTGELSFPAHPAQEEPAASIAVAYPSLQDASSLQHASWIIGLPTPQSTEAYEAVSQETETNYLEADSQETESQAPEVNMDDGVTETGLQQDEGTSQEWWNQRETIAYFEELFGKEPDHATTCYAASSDAGIMYEDSSRAMMGAADKATTSSKGSLDETNREPFNSSEEYDTESTLSPQTSKAGMLDLDKLSSPQDEILYTHNVPQQEVHQEARQDAENVSLADTAAPWGDYEEAESGAAPQYADDDSLPDTDPWDPQLTSQRATEDLGVVSSAIIEVEEEPMALEAERYGLEVQEKVLLWRQDVDKEADLDGPEEWRAENKQSRLRVMSHTKRAPFKRAVPIEGARDGRW